MIFGAIDKAFTSTNLHFTLDLKFTCDFVDEVAARGLQMPNAMHV